MTQHSPASPATDPRPAPTAPDADGAATAFRLYDTATRTVRDFVPVVPGQVSIYHCGLTVQSAPHVGHIRKEVVFDVLRRWLTHRGFAVTVIANVTDIDDKILTKSAEAGVPWFAHAYRFERELHDAYAALGCEPPTYEPRATGHIPEMVELIEVLVERGHAYAADDGSGDVYFDVRSWPAYGSLSGQRIDDMEAAEDADPRGKRDPRDFALWKGHKPGEPATASWPTPWGRGRPGWHLECSAMAGKYLGDEFDIHGGGLDLRFPHHENELAQSTAAGQRFARFWMHNAWVTAAGEKMSKSLGNGALVSEVTRAFPPRAVRFYLAQPHYRSAIEFSDDSLAEATAALARIDGFVTRAAELVPDAPAAALPEAFVAAMDDDLSTPAAVAVLYAAVRDGNTALDAGDLDALALHLGRTRAMLGVLGLDADDPAWTRGAGAGPGQDYRPVVDGLVAALVEQRAAARARKDYAAADAVRDALAALGVVLEDTPRGTRWSLASPSETTGA
ncbi:cysteinyl-tRNA synthetase [Microlunatus capsulatus]|uniref:Cysteine--tRNA ligase n=1 Tax=Microlunatus capsulatus TaxID=99117 RepID=A0ABS4ZAA0_9ACTN|nr:cysteine--tRNA ligase [Microlunatus capsulatus]MBP2417884.1 cysteinyl-tRNA synthetase [Microlunatus capsulatus]